MPMPHCPYCTGTGNWSRAPKTAAQRPASRASRAALLLLVALALLPPFAGLAAPNAQRATPAAGIRFNRDVRPILTEHCFPCHGPDSAARKADLRLDLRATAIARGVLVPGRPERSRLVARLFAPQAALRMPPATFHKQPSAAQRQTLKRWIAQGARYEPHWAFVPLPARVPVPMVPAVWTYGSVDARTKVGRVRLSARPHVGTSTRSHTPKPWTRNPIDAFVLDRLLRAGLTPSPEASPAEWLRRVTLDLTGLPPTLAEIEAFLADRSPDAHEKVVDRLLASPRFGERMAVPWLDLARYADSYGYQSDQLSPTWPYRDWVVKAFNDNLPYDRFLAYQIAGDILGRERTGGRMDFPPALGPVAGWGEVHSSTQDSPGQAVDSRQACLATAFNRLHRMTNEGGSVPEEWRLEGVADRVNTFGTAVLGLTVECARCHDHKYDPVAQRDYYALSAFFNSIDEHGLYDRADIVPTPTLLLPTPEQEREESTARAAVAQAESTLARARQDADARFRAWLAATDAVPPAQASELAATHGKHLRCAQVTGLRGLGLGKLAISWAGGFAANQGNTPLRWVNTVRSQPAQAGFAVGSCDFTRPDLAPIVFRPDRADDPECARPIPVPDETGRFDFEAFEGTKLPNRLPGATEHGTRADEVPLVEGYRGKSAQLDGENNVHFPQLGRFTRHTPFTIAFRMFDPRIAAEPAVIFQASSGTDTGPHGYDLLLDQGQLTARLFRHWPGNAIAVRARTAIAKNGWIHVAVTYDGSSRAAGLRIYLDGRPAELEVVRDRLYKGTGQHTLVFGQRFRDRGFKGGRIDDLRIFTRDLTPLEIVHLFDGRSLDQALATDAPSPASEAALRQFYLSAIDAEMRQAAAALAAARARLVAAEDAQLEVAVMEDLPEPRPAHVLARGHYEAPKNEANRVERGTPVAVLPFPRELRRDRLGLARWLTRPDHPLTARVAANRLWALFFGRGLVETQENFGLQGTPPTHPELLDWLALAFREGHRPAEALGGEGRGAFLTSSPPAPLRPPAPGAQFQSERSGWRGEPRISGWVPQIHRPIPVPPLQPERPLAPSTPGRLVGEGPGVRRRVTPNAQSRALAARPWNVKALCRLIVLSATYRQSSAQRPEATRRDPNNQLLARGPSHRLGAEAIRDLALAASGLLDDRIGGPPVSPYQPGDLWRESNTMSPAYRQSVGRDLYRRSLYTVWKRTAPLPSMLAFDAVSREVCVARRPTTSTPLQALVLLNDPQFVEAARVLGERILKEAPDPTPPAPSPKAGAGAPGSVSRVRFVFRLLATREPTAQELRLLVAFYDAQRIHYARHPAEAEKLLKIGERKPDPALPPAEVAATTALAQAVLNLDAVIWKR